MKLYIAGPMTGLPEHNLPAFFDAERQLVERGFEVLNPASHGVDPAKTWLDYMRLDIVMVASADGIALLPGWEASRGARIEHDLGVGLGLPVGSLAGWLTDGPAP